MDKIDWIESQAQAHMKERDTNAQLLEKQATQLLLLLLSGGAGSLALAITHKDYRVVLTSVCAWLFIISTYLVLNCFMYGNYPSTHNEPRILLNHAYDEWSLERLRRAELIGLQKRIDEAKKIIFEKSEVINRALIAVCLTPIVAFIFWQA